MSPSRCACCLVPAALALLSAPALSQEAALPDAAALLDRSERDAKGKVGRIDRLVLRGKSELTLKIGSAPPRTLPGQFEEYHDGARFYMVADYGDAGRHEEGCDGEVVWEIDPNTGANIKTGEDRAVSLRMAGLLRGSWRDFYAWAKAVGTRDLDGVPCWTIVMQPKEGEGDAELWYVDREDDRLRGMDLRMRLDGPNKGQVLARMTDYERVDGVDWPRTYALVIGVVTITIHYDHIERDAAIPAERFALPAAVVRLRQEEAALPPPPKAAASAGPGAPGKYEFSITTLPERNAVSIRATAAPQDIGATLSVILPEVMDYLTSENVMPTGPPFTRYHSFGADAMDLEGGMTVAKPMAGTERIKPTTLPAGKVATTFHVGPYHELGNAYRALHEWLAAEKKEPAGAPWEVYLTDPGTEPDPSKYTTKIFWPIKE